MLKQKLNDLINETIIELHKDILLTDDQYDEALQNGDYRDETIQLLLELLHEIKEE